MTEKSYFTGNTPSVNLHLRMFCLSEQNGKIDMTFFTHDCFHFTIKGHEELAKGLWNNMVNNECHCLYLVEQEVKGQQRDLLCEEMSCSICSHKRVKFNELCNRKKAVGK